MRQQAMNKVTALSILSNAVLIWNTVRIGDIVAALWHIPWKERLHE
jgi:TnpA family transposase